MQNQVAVIGGAGHIGLPLALVLAKKKFDTTVIDQNLESLSLIKRKESPFLERGMEELLNDRDLSKHLFTSNTYESIAKCKYLFITVGTPVDQYQNSRKDSFIKLGLEISPYIDEDKLIILRSTVTPNMSRWFAKLLRELTGKNIRVAFCPERTIQGDAINEIQTLPQLIGCDDQQSSDECRAIFSKITMSSLIYMSTTEAELAKLFTNAYRYISFAIANEFYELADTLGLNYNEILSKMKVDYPRSNSIPTSGFTAGPCLLKDTAQINSFFANQFKLGNSAIEVNEGFPLFLADKIIKMTQPGCVIGILGLTFKADIDDIRDSLAFKLLRRLKENERLVKTFDPYYKHPEHHMSLKNLLNSVELVVVATPHKIFNDIEFPTNVKVVNPWT